MEVSLAEAIGHVSAVDVSAPEAVPPFANTAMDGFAVRSADTSGAPLTLAVLGTLAAGARPDLRVGPGQAIRIMTGAPMPPGADAVVMVERTRPAGEGLVLVEVAASPGDHVRAAGSDLAEGSVVVSAGSVLGPGRLGVLASVGLTTIAVVRRPRVGVLSTGDELVSDPRPLLPGEIRDSNRVSVAAAATESGFDVVDLGTARDDETAIEAAIRAGVSSCDALLTTGGVSVGDFDYTKAVLNRLSGGTMRWMEVAIKPARPFAFGTVAGVPVFGLPGNPVSALVSFECLARPALRKMAGHSRLERPRAAATADEGFDRRPDGKLYLLRVIASRDDAGRLHVRSAGGQSSHQLAAMAEANALALVPDGEGIPRGGAVEVLLLGPEV